MDAGASAAVATLRPGAKFQDSVNKYPTGTIFTLKAGIFRLQSVTPKSGMSFIGEAGAVLSGARLLTSFTRQGIYWVAGNQTQEGSRIAEFRASGRKNCMPDATRCFYPEELWINNLAVAPRHRRQGLGRWLLGRVLDGARERGCRVARLEVRPTNRSARRLYEAHGFREIGRRKGYYQSEGEDAIVMELEL